MSDINQIEFSEISKKDELKSIIESLLFVSGEPLALKDICRIVEEDFKYVEDLMRELMNIYNGDSSRGIKIISLNGTYQLVTKTKNSEYVQKLLKKNVRQSLSQASLESLAIICYKQPITRVEIDEIRGVKSESAIQRLVEKNLVEETGRLEVPGRPILYGTTDEFLRQFGLETLKELPSLDLYNDEEAKSSMDVLNQALEDKNNLRDRVIMILNTVGDIDDSAHLNRELLNAIIITLNECYNQITKYLDNLPDNETDSDGLLYKEWFKEIEPFIDNVDLLKKLLMDNKDGDYMSVLREIQKEILKKLNDLFDKDIDSIYNNGTSPEWKEFLNTVHNRKVYAQIDSVKFESDPNRAERKQCAYLLSDLENKPELYDCSKTDIDSLSKNRFIFLYVKKVTLDELVLFKNVK